MIGAKNIVDPLKLNKGQLIHSSGANQHINNSQSIVYDDICSDKSNVDKCRSKNTSKNAKKIMSKNVVFVDWFETTLDLMDVSKIDWLSNHIILSENLILENRGHGRGFYKNLWNVIYMGEVFGELLTHGTKHYMGHTQGQFKINNEHLYRVDWLDTYKEIIQLMGWSHISTTRLDIAIDGVAGDNAKRIATRHLNGRVIGRKGKAKLSVTYASDKTMTRFHNGSPNSIMTATIYNKTADIDLTDKTYIRDAWNQNNLEQKTDNVNRFELRMKSKALPKKDFDWTRFDDVNYLASIVRTKCKNWFEFYYNGTDKNVHRNYKKNTMKWINWDEISGELLPKHQAITKTGVHRAKRIIKDLHYLQHVENKTIDFTIVLELMDEFALGKWFDDRIDNWKITWDRESKYKNISSS
jgi:hypothetical protein